MQIILLLCYPFLVHFSIIYHLDSLRLAAIVFLAAGLLWKPLLSASPFAWGVAGSVILLVVVQQWAPWAMNVIFIPPVALHFLVASVFIQSLLPGQTPLVTAIGEFSRGPLSPSMIAYTAAVTWLWAIMLSLLTLLSAVLPFIGNLEIWSLFTNFINYLLVAFVFVAEFIYRRYRFPDHKHPGFIEYIRIVVDANIRKHR